VNSEVGVGSVFTVRIPVQFRGETEVAHLPDAKPELDATKLPVLVVEDNREALFIYQKYLKDSNFQAVPASSIREARAAMRSMRPHAILLDVLLQGEHSWDFLRDLKADPTTREIPVYVITVVDNRDKALALGADAFHPKPVERAWLLKQLEVSLSSHPSHQVLVVDDDATSRYLLKVVLSQANYDIAEAGGGMEGLRMARELSPALIVLDLVMDDLSGFEVLEQLSADPATRSIPVVIHSSKDLDKVERARLSAAIDIVPKTVMSSRESALASFSEAFRKAGLTLLPTHDQVVAAE
jgi:CheY-like chemotaxis protein